MLPRMRAGDTIDKYVIESDLGEGGMGRVYVARDPVLDRKVALKLVRPTPGETEEARKEAIARLFREARAAAKLDHPNVVTIFDMGETEGVPFLAMELVKGRTLREAAADPSVSVEQRLSWLRDVARALAAAHRAGILHRDVKPENVMVREDGVVKVLDFGIARRVRSAVDPVGPTATPALPTLTNAGVSIGTPLYMAPEQISGDELTGRTDQFAWGVMAHEVLTGAVPWRTKNDALGLVAAILTQPAPGVRQAAPAVSTEAEAVIAKCLSKSPSDRYSTMDDVVAALGAKASPSVAVAASSPGAAVAPSALKEAKAGGGASVPEGRTTAARRYSDDEIREIVARASQRQAGDDRLSHAELLEIAREVGLDEGSIESAARDMARERESPRAPGSAPVAIRDEKAPETQDRGGAIRKFFNNLGSFAIVNVFLYFVFHGPAWQRWVLFGWGLSLAFQLLRIVFPKEGEDKGKRRSRGEEPSRAEPPSRGVERDRIIEAGVEEVLRATQRRKLRIAGQTGKDQVRIGDEEREREAEAEALASAEARPQKDQR